MKGGSKVTLKVGNHQTAGETPFKWYFAGVPMVAQHWILAFIALWIFRGSGPVLLRTPIFLWFFRGEGSGLPVPPTPLLIRSCGRLKEATVYMRCVITFPELAHIFLSCKLTMHCAIECWKIELRRYILINCILSELISAIVWVCKVHIKELSVADANTNRYSIYTTWYDQKVIILLYLCVFVFNVLPISLSMWRRGYISLTLMRYAREADDRTWDPWVQEKWRIHYIIATQPYIGIKHLSLYCYTHIIPFI